MKCKIAIMRFHRPFDMLKRFNFTHARTNAITILKYMITDRNIEVVSYCCTPKCLVRRQCYAFLI